ncbi:hypothetical protein K7X08_008623 [Anisodus acutangulus]|uniref:Uncharacterized protein n=1 Tax=Anisodus acutangulus TaxID=402998 RepID=A0A9Q1MXR6_9SOLA|nr:hypothetical protein K7X08_008623 [Anisodus acutangulus]
MVPLNKQQPGRRTPICVYLWPKENGKLEQYKLAPEGIKQAELAGESFLKVLKEDNLPLENVRICYSPFSRTTHTAQVVASVLDVSFERPQCMVLDDLRECFFGPSYELKSHEIS